MKKIWCLELKTNDCTSDIEMLHYNLETRQIETTKLNYAHAIFLMCNKNFKKFLIDLLLECFDDDIVETVDTTIPFKCLPNNVIDLLTQFNKCEYIYIYDLMQISVINIMSCYKIHKFLKHNQEFKNDYFLIDNTQLAFNICMQNMIQQLTSVKLSFENELLNRKKYTLRIFNYARKQINTFNFLNQYYNFENYFLLTNMYTLTTNRKLELIENTNTSSLYKLLPIISIDIETSARTMTDFPLGANEYEKIVSLTLYASYNNRLMIVVLYLRFFQMTAKTSEAWNNIDKQLTIEATTYYKKKYPQKHVFSVVLSYANEADLLRAFYEWYMNGRLLHILCNDKNMVHFLTGHNIIRYDLPFILTRFKWHQLHNYIDNIVTYNTNIDNEMIFIKFHARAILLDSLVIFKQHSLGAGYTLSLKNLANSFVSDVATKVDLNSVNIRYYYILDHYHKDFTTKCRMELLKLITANMKNTRFTTNTLKLTTIPLTLTDVVPDHVKCLLNNLHKINLYTIAQIVQYNIIDCEIVVALWEKFAYQNLFTETIKQYPSDNLESALHGNVSKRMHSLFSFYSINYAQQLIQSPVCHLNKLKANVNVYYNDALLQPNVVQNVTTHDYDNSTNQQLSTFLQASGIGDESSSSSFVEKIIYKTTRKKFAGAAVYFTKCFATNTCQCDVVSMYPNIIIGKKINIDSSDIVSCGILRHLLKNPSRLKVFKKLIDNNYMSIFLAEDEHSKNYKLYLTNFSCNEFKNIVGRVLFDLDELKTFSNNTPLIVKLHETNAFINLHIKKMLAKRKELQKMMKQMDKNDTKRVVYDSKQKSIKIAVNSMYGQFGNVNVPIAATTTLYGRKILMFASKIMYYIILKTIKCLHNNDTNDQWLENYNYKTAHKTMELLNFSNDFFQQQLSESFLIHLHKRITLDCCENIHRYNELVKILQKYQHLQRDFDALPEQMKNMIYDGDTDGFQFENIFYLDADFLCNKLNNFVKQYFNVDNILFENTENTATLCIEKKRYTIYNNMPAFDELSLETIKMCRIKHSGYERNAVPHIKHICKYVALLSYYMYFNNVSKNIEFRDLVLSIYTYLRDNAKNDELYINVGFKKLKNNCARRRFIDSITTSYTGNVNAVFIYNYNTQEEQYITLQDYIENSTKYTLNYPHFLRTYSQVWYNQFHIGRRTFHNNLPLSKIPSMMMEFFQEWLQQPTANYTLLDIKQCKILD